MILLHTLLHYYKFLIILFSFNVNFLIYRLRDWNGKVPVPAVMKPNKGKPGSYKAYWTGKQVFSMFCPKINLRKGLNKLFTAGEDFGETDQGYHYIEDGEGKYSKRRCEQCSYRHSDFY